MNSKSVIIDFDNTIGYFDQLIYIINIIEKVNSHPIMDIELFTILDQYPYIFRPLINEIFDIILHNKDNQNIKLFVLYTCNTNKVFVNQITKYLQKKLNKNNIFEYIIHEKSKVKNIYSIVKETNINQNNDILCFIDDKVFDYENKPNVKYIKCESYVYNYDLKEIIYKFPYQYFCNIDSALLKKYFHIINIKKKKKKTKCLPFKAYELNSQHILYILRSFFTTPYQTLL
jgi:hypothetical protein